MCIRDGSLLVALAASALSNSMGLVPLLLLAVSRCARMSESLTIMMSEAKSLRSSACTAYFDTTTFASVCDTGARVANLGVPRLSA